MNKKKEFINEILALNPNMKKVGTSDVWMGEPALIPTSTGLKMVNCTVTVPAGAKYEDRTFIKDGIKIRIWQP